MSEISYFARKVICSDNVVRTASVRYCFDGSSWQMYPDTWFSVPSRVKAFGKTISGYVTSTEDGLVFHPYKYRKNGNILP